MIVNKKQLADILGVSERSLSEWQKDSTFPIKLNAGRGASNQYDTTDVIEWMVQRALNGQQQESSRDRLDRIRADREEIALVRDIDELVPCEPLKEKLERIALSIRTALLNGNSKLKTEIDTLYDINLDIVILHDHSRSLLTHLSEIDGKSGSRGQQGDAGLSPAAADVDDGMGQ